MLRDNKSPAKALYGRELRDFLPGSALMGEMWMNLADTRETALGCRATNAEKEWSEHTMAIPPLMVGDTVAKTSRGITHSAGTRGGPL